MLTSRDEEILKTIHFYRFMSVIDVSYRLFKPGAKTHVRAILSNLCGGDDKVDNQYLYRFGMPKSTQGNPERIFTLGSRGREFLSKYMDIQVKWTFKPRVINYNYLLHNLVLTRVLVAAHWWSRNKTTLKLVETRISHELTSLPDGIVPDGWLAFEQSDGSRGGVLVEIDRGTEFQVKFKEHIKARLEFVRSGQDRKLFGDRAFLIVYITTGEHPYRATRRTTMAQWTREVLKEVGREEWSSVFRFTDVGLDEVYEANLFENTMWYSPDSDKGIKLFGP